MSDTETAETTTSADRDIDTLLKLTSYDGLTDGEVRKLIDWHERLSYQSAQTDFQNSATTTLRNDVAKAADVAWQNAQAAFTNACAISPDFKTLSDLGVTNG